MNIQDLKLKLRSFAEEREWDQFHSPKNLAMALGGEAGELLEHFQWLTEDQSRRLTTDQTRMAKVSEEVADIAIYIVRLCDKLDIDLESAIENKIRANAAKYPVNLAKGNATKYTEFGR
jgi:NTP pyrophosphatase (non-canonical NTP hydrolase)